MSARTHNEPDPYGFYPFWFWNGKISEEEIRWQVAEMADKGIRGFYIHPRQGLQEPYLSEAFFRLVTTAVEAAEQHGLIVNLYDEYPYPSGVAGGEVILGEPRFYATSLVQKAFDVPGGPTHLVLPRGQVLFCLAYPLADGQVDWSRGTDLLRDVGTVLVDNSYNETGLTKYNRKRYFASNPTPILETDALEGPHRIFVSTQIVVEHHKYWGNYLDVLNPEAVKRFIELTHERYREHLGDRFGQTIHAIFTDETAPGWSAVIPKAFEAEYGYDLLPLLPALQDVTHPQHLGVAHDLERLQYRLFCQAFEEQVSQWCGEHSLRYAGEKPSLRLEQLAYMDIPGCEPGHTKAGAPMDLLQPRIRQNARATASAAYFYGKEGALCECFHSLGWSDTLQDAKLISEGLLLMGIRYLVPHGFFYTTHALAKHDAPPTFFFQMPYWPLFGALTKRVDAIAKHLEGTHIEAQVVVVDPSSGLPTRSDLADYGRLLDMLMEEQIEFLIADTDILEGGTIQDGHVRLREILADMVILPPMRVVERPLETWLGRLETSGGGVLRLASGFEREECLRRIGERVQPSLGIEAIIGDPRRLQVVRRTDGQRTWWFLLNTSEQSLEVDLSAVMALREIPLDDDLPPMLEGSSSAYRRKIGPFESVLLEGAAADDPRARLPHITVAVGGSMLVRPLNKNLLRMGEWQMTLLGDSNEPLQTSTVRPMPIPNQLAEGGFRYAPVLRTFFGCTPELALPLIKAEYSFRFENQFSGPVELVMEPGSIEGDWQLVVNGGRPITLADFAETDAHVRGSLGVDITPFLNAGSNTITVQLATDRIDGGLLNSLYLAGEFAVRLNPPSLTELTLNGEYEAWEANGLPYYAGVVEYETSFDLERLPEGDKILIELAHSLPFQDAVEASVNGSPWQAMPWSPYRMVLPASYLNRGRNLLTIRVYTTLIRSFEGCWFDIEDHCYREVGTGRALDKV